MHCMKYEGAYNMAIHSGMNLKQYGRLPPAYFAPSQFGKDAILKAENVFSSKKTLLFFNFFHHIFFFPTFKVFVFLPNKPHNEGLKHIFKEYYHIIRILQQIYL